MHPSPEALSAIDPLLEVLEALAPPDLHQSAWAVCQGKGWYFGSGSNAQDTNRFWKLDLDDEAIFNQIWEKARPRCEALAGGALRVIRQYANGHTYGLGGIPHLDAKRPGAYTLLYYPNAEWKDNWDGETFFYDQNGEVALAVRPRPNRAVFFDSRILHNGRASSRDCPALRVTVAYKLERIDAAARPRPAIATEPAAFQAREIGRDGASRSYQILIPSATIDPLIVENLKRIGQSVRLPGFRDGNIPEAVLRQRYGAKARSEAIKRLIAESIQRALPAGLCVAALEVRSGAESGDLDFHLAATYLPDLPSPDGAGMTFTRLEPDPQDAVALGLSIEDAASLSRRDLKRQVLDYLDTAYSTPQFAPSVEQEFDRLWKYAAGQGQIPKEESERKALVEELRQIAERRLRLAVLAAEFGRRFQIQASGGAELEDAVIGHLLSLATVEQRVATIEEFRELAQA